MNGRTLPLYWLPVSFAAFAAFFPDRFAYIGSLFAAIVLYLAAFRAGKILLKRHTAQAFYFPFGLGVLLVVAYVCFTFTTQIIVIATLWLVFITLALPETPLLLQKFPLKLLAAAPFVLLGYWSCMTPATFFDALVYHLGLPYQYLSLGRMQVIPHHLYSAFPPLNQVLNLLFIGIHAPSAIKIFSIGMLFGMLHCAAAFIDGSKLRMEALVISFLCIPSIWILVHLITGDLLTALFFCAGVFLLCAQLARKDSAAIAAFLIAFSCWTKWNALLYLPFLLIFFWKQWTKAVSFAAIIALLILPLLIRNYITVGDPLYPILSVKLKNPLWSPEQKTALQKDSFPARTRTIAGILSAPLKLITNPDDFGSASEIGFTPVLGLLFYPLAAVKRRKLLVYIAACFFAWVYVFPNFRQFYPVFVLLMPVMYSGWAAIREKSGAAAYVAMAFCAATSLYILRPVYQHLFPLISVKENREEYLESNVRYYGIAKSLATGRAILIGETRSAYFKIPVVASTAYDRSPFLHLLHGCSNAECLYRALSKNRITSIVYNRPQFQKRTETYSWWRISAEEQRVLNDFVQKYTVPRLRFNGIYLLELYVAPVSGGPLNPNSARQARATNYFISFSRRHFDWSKP